MYKQVSNYGISDFIFKIKFDIFLLRFEYKTWNSDIELTLVDI